MLEDNFLVFIVVFSVISLLGTIGNLLTILCFWRKKDKHTSSFFILVLAMSDLVASSLLVPFTIYMESVSFEITNVTFCKIYFFLITTTVPFSCLLMTSIAFDRYFCICYVHISRNLFTVNKAKIVSLILMLTSSLLGVIPAFHAYVEINAAQNFTNSTYSYTCTLDTRTELDYIGNLVLTFKNFYDLIYVVSVVMVTFLYIAIYKEIRVKNRIKAERIRKLTNLEAAQHNNKIDFSNETYALSKPDKKESILKDFGKNEWANGNDNNKKSNNNNKNQAPKKIKIKSEADSTNSVARIIPFLISIKDTRTAFMLFLVTFFYLISYLPSILATRLILPNDNLFIVYFYFSTAMINPIIYSFLNRSFRADLIKLFTNSKSLFRSSLNSYHTSYSVGKKYSVAV